MFSSYVGFTGDHFFLLGTDSTYSRIPWGKGGPFFSDRIFLVLILRTNWCTSICIACPILHKIVRFLREIEYNEFVCNKFVLVFVQIDLIQVEFSNCIRSICTKTKTHLLHTNSLHSILCKMGHVIQIVVHQFVHKTSTKKSALKKNQSHFTPRYMGIRRISTKEIKNDLI
jgi:hypothetical protein